MVIGCDIGVSVSITFLLHLCRYTGEVGDLVVGRIASVDSKRWKVDIHAQRDAVLPLSSINLASGEQRMKTYEDQLAMRTLFEEGDLVCAEIQNLNTDGVISLHSRSLKYGKLENGQLIVVAAALVQRLPHHYVSLSYGVDVILGKNGYIWITRSIPEAWKQETDDVRDDITPLVETLQRIRTRHATTPMTLEDRLKVVRTRNVIAAIAKAAELAEGEPDAALTVSPETIAQLYQKSIEMKMQPQVSADNYYWTICSTPHHSQCPVDFRTCCRRSVHSRWQRV
jgi:exosome complex component RRP4